MLFMKKFNQIKINFAAIAVFALLANAANAQTLKVTRGGVPITDGEVIELKWEYEVFSVPEWDLYTYNFRWDPHLEASTDGESASLTVTVTSVDDTDGFQLCWPSGCQEVHPNSSTSASGTINAQPQDLSIHKAFEFVDPNQRPSSGGTILVRLSSGSETMEVKVKALMEGDAGVGENLSDPTQKSTYFTLQGTPVSTPQKGQLYIECKGGKAVKRVF